MFVSAALAPSDLPDRLGTILAGLRRVLALRAGRDRAMAAILLVLWGRLGRILTRVVAIAARHRAGTLRAPRTVGSRPAAQPPPSDPLPRRRAWLVLSAPECAAYGEQLRALLAEPEMAALIEAAPQVRRLLRPLWRMLQPEPPPPVLQTSPEPTRLSASEPKPGQVPRPPADGVPPSLAPTPDDPPTSSHKPFGPRS